MYVKGVVVEGFPLEDGLVELSIVVVSPSIETASVDMRLDRG